MRLIRRSHGHMRLVIALLFLICQAAAGQSIVAEPARTVQVRSYVRKDGTVVAAYTRAEPGTGTAPRSTAARRAFQAQQPCPSTTGRTGACPGYVVDHIEPLACGGFDAPENMQWQSVAEARAKDRWERNDCELPVAIPRVALVLEPLMGSYAWRSERRDQRTGSSAPRSVGRVTAAGRRSRGIRIARLSYAHSRSTSHGK
jgi:hypothetical protein